MYCCQRLPLLLIRHAEGSAQPVAKPAEDKEPAKAEPAQQSSNDEKPAEPTPQPPPEPAQMQQESEPVNVGVERACFAAGPDMKHDDMVAGFIPALLTLYLVKRVLYTSRSICTRPFCCTTIAVC